MKYQNMRFRVLSCAAVVAALCAVPGCSTQTVSGKPLSELTFDTVQPLYVSAAHVNIVNNYNPSADPQDVSSRLPTPPDIAVRRWAERRLQPAGGFGVLNFAIDSVTVREAHNAPQTTMQRWSGQGASTRYDVALRLSMAKESDARMGNSRHAMTVTRTVTIPDNWSIAQREHELQTFVETLVAEVDKAVTATLQNENLLAPAPFAPAPLSTPGIPSAPPEMGREQYQYGEDL